MQQFWNMLRTIAYRLLNFFCWFWTFKGESASKLIFSIILLEVEINHLFSRAQKMKQKSALKTSFIPSQKGKKMIVFVVFCCCFCFLTLQWTKLISLTLVKRLSSCFIWILPLSAARTHQYRSTHKPKVIYVLIDVLDVNVLWKREKKRKHLVISWADFLQFTGPGVLLYLWGLKCADRVCSREIMHWYVMQSLVKCLFKMFTICMCLGSSGEVWAVESMINPSIAIRWLFLSSEAFVKLTGHSFSAYPSLFQVSFHLCYFLFCFCRSVGFTAASCTK